MKTLEELVDWLLESEYIQISGACGISFKNPRYEITPKDFLKFAESDLHENNPKCRIGVLANLKRAMDCQLDMFFETLNLKVIFDKHNLKFETKTKFLADVGMLQNKSINKLNTMRNKMEHEYSLPTEEDLDIYYEVIWNVIEIISLNIQLMSMGEVDSTVQTPTGEFYFSSNYDVEKMLIVFRVWAREKREDVIEISLKEKSDYDTFVKGFKIFRYMIEFQNLMDYEHFMEMIKLL